MSTTYFTFTFLVLEVDLPESIHSFDDYTSRLNNDVKAGKTLMSASRNNWLIGSIEQIAHHYKKTALEFLYKSDNSTLTNSTGYRWLVSKVGTADIQAVIVDIERLMSEAEEDSEQFATVLCDGRASELLEALRSSTGDCTKNNEPKGEDEGQGPIYFFAYLKCLLILLRNAQTNMFCLIHASPAP